MVRPIRDNRRPSRARTGVLLAAAAGTVLAVAVMPSPPRLDEATTGDAELARTVRDLAGGSGWQSLSVAVIDAGGVRTAGVGTTGGADPQPVDETTAYEIGSVGKVLTGMLLSDSGLDPDTPVSDLLPDVEFNDAGTASATLAELAAHRSGLPRLRITPPSLVQSVLYRFVGVDPYAGDDRAAVLADAAAASAGSKGEVRYSNLGVALLGQALAQQAGMPYRALLTDRILEPLGMQGTTVAGAQAELPVPRAEPFRANGLAVEPWLASGWGPAGVGPWSTAADLAVLVRAMLDGTAPGADAARPRFAAGENEQIGYGWFTDTVGGRQITWHNGGTGGFRSFVGFDTDAGVGVVVLGNTDRSVDPIGRQLLGVDSADGPPVLQIGVTLFLTFGGALMMYLNRRTDRLGLVRDVFTGLVMLLVAYTAGSWEVVPPVVWILGVGTLAAAAVPVASRWPELPIRATGRTWTRVTGTAVPMALGLALAIRLAMT